MVDGVFNFHTGREFFAFRDIQQNRKDPATVAGIKA